MHLQKYGVYQETYGDDNKHTIQSKLDLIAFYKTNNKVVELEKFYLSLLETYKTKYGDKNISKTVPLLGMYR